jgi:hypothetical protein
MEEIQNTILPIFNDDGSIKVEEGVVPELNNGEEIEPIAPVTSTAEEFIA